MFNLSVVGKQVALNVALLCMQFIWLYLFNSEKIALINLLPTFLFIPLCIAFSYYAWDGLATFKKYAFIVSALILTLRLSLTIAPWLIWLSWLCFLVCLGLVIYWCFSQLKQKATIKILYITIGLVVFNTLTHVSLSSPFTHTYHLINEQPSSFTGKDNNSTWECAYEVSFFAVHCDARHFIASEKIFTEPSYDPSFSVVLSRVYSGYLNSLIGVENQRWIASTIINSFFWLLSCFAIFRLCLLMGLSPTIAQISMLSTASAWGFVSMVAQPAPYLLSFAFAIFSLWAVIEIIKNNGQAKNKYFILLLISIISILVYETYPIIAACIILLCLYQRWKSALLITLGQITVSLLWKKVSMEKVLGTAGDLASASSGISNITKDINAWLDVFLTFNVPEFLKLTWVGLQAYTFGNLVIGALAAIVFITWYRKQSKQHTGSSLLWYAVLLVNALMFAAIVFIVPQTFHWSPSTGMQPRLAFFSFGLNIIALVFICSHLFPNKLMVIPVLFFIMAQIDVYGIASHAMMFDYGKLGWYSY